MTEQQDEDKDALSNEELAERLNNPPPYVPFPSFNEFVVAGFDPATLNQFVAVLQRAKEDATPERLRMAVDRATKWAAIDTGAIEGLYQVERGFTFSVAAEAAAWDNLHLHIGETAERAIRDALNGYEYVMDVATNSRPITEVWIKELHSVICRSQETYTVITAAGRQEHTLEKGVYKKYRNNPFNFADASIHSYAPVEDTPAEMHRLISELESENFKSANSVLQAAYAHYSYVCIHPFADGNGRVARALSSVYLYRSPGVPLVVFADQKPGYIGALEAADAGEFSLFIGLVADQAIDVVRMVARDMTRVPRPSLAERMKEMQAALMGRGGLSHLEVDALGSLLFDEFVNSVNRAITNNPVEDPLSLDVRVVPNYPVGASNEPYRVAPNPRAVIVTAISAAPATASVNALYGVAIAKGDSQVADFIVVREPSDVLEEALLRDLSPSVGPALTYRLDAVAEEQIFDLIDRVIDAGAAKLRETGYR